MTVNELIIALGDVAYGGQANGDTRVFLADTDDYTTEVTGVYFSPATERIAFFQVGKPDRVVIQ